MRNRFGVEEKLYEGNVYANLKRINKDGLIVAPVAYGLQRRVECLDMESSEEERSFWNGYFFSGDGIAEHPDGSFKIVFDAFAHPEFKQWGKMQKREFVFNEGVYERLQGVFCTLEQRRRLNKDFILEDALVSLEWNMFARHQSFVGAEKAFDSRLLNEYARRIVFTQFRETMGVYLSDLSPQKPRLRALCVSWLGDFGGSRASGNSDLDYVGGGLVGIVPGALEGARQRSFELCERLSNEQYPILKRDEVNEAITRTGNSETLNTRNGNTDLASSMKQEIVATPTYCSFLDSNAPLIPLDIPTEEDVARRNAEAAAQEAKDKAWREKSWNLNRRENDS